MSDNIKDLSVHLHAFAIGCLDREDYQKVLSHIRASADFPYQELGEYQNLSSLLTSFLDIETPASSVKDKVARKLYRLKEQKRPDRTTKISPQEQTSNFGGFTPEVELPEQESSVEQEKVQYEPPINTSDEESVSVEPYETSETKLEIREEETSALLNNYSDTQEYFPNDESEEELSDFKSVTPFSRRSSEINRPKQETQVHLRNKQEVPNRDEFEAEHSDLASLKSFPPEIDDYESVTSDELIENEFSGQESSDDVAVMETPESDFSASYSSELDNTESETKPSNEEKSKGQLGTPRYQPLSAVSMTDDFEKEKKEEKIIEKIVYKPESVKSVSPLLIIILFVMLGAGIGAVYYFLSKEVQEVQVKSEKQFQDIQSANLVVAKNKPLIDILSAKNTKVFTLQSTDGKKNSFARLYYNADSDKGLMMLGNLPVLENNQVYHLWVSIYRAEYSLGSINYDGKTEYYPVQNFPTDIFTLKEINLFITIEAAGSEKPSSAPMLTAIVKN